MVGTVRYLITTADERTWKFDRPVIFLGEWCRLFERKHIWQNLDAIVAKPYGLGKLQKEVDLVEARNIEEKIFPVLCDALNRHHGTKHDLRFWQITLGHWFRRYVDVMFNRVRTLEYAFQNYKLSGTTIVSTGQYNLAPVDSNCAILAFNDDSWNNHLYARISIFFDENFKIEQLVNDEDSDGFYLPPIAEKPPIKRQILSWGFKQYLKFAKYFSREKDIFIINSYLPKKSEIKLQLLLGQGPQFWRSIKHIFLEKPDITLRRKLTSEINQKSNDIMSYVVRSMLFELLPICYLEGFAKLSEKVKYLPWPKTPKLIFTSNNFDTDEIFKLWTANRVKSGSKYITGQHGNNYGTYSYMYPSIEEVSADKFLTWGWTDGLPQHTPAFIFKTARRNTKSYDPSGGLLLIEVCIGHRLNTWDVTYEYLTYFRDQLAFVDKLANVPRENLIVRLHAGYKQQRWSDELRWKSFDCNIKLDKGILPIAKLVTKSRLVVYSYDSTGLFEALSQNIPTLAFWQNELDHLRESAKPYYQILLDAGIVHLTAEAVADKVNEVWDDADGWWFSDEVQGARKVFCEQFARTEKNPVQALKRILVRETEI